MANNHLNTYSPHSVSPPGGTIRDLIDELGITQKELAEKMKVSGKALNEMIKGKVVITKEVAIRLEKILKTPASFWLSREKQYREFLASQKKSENLKKKSSITVHILKKTA